MQRAMCNWLLTRSRWQTHLILFAAGALMALGFAPYHAWPVVFICLPLVYMLLVPAAFGGAAISRRQAMVRAFLFGYGHAMAGTWWIANALLVDADKFGWLLPFSVLGLSAVMALWFVPLGFAVHALRPRMNVLLFAALWVLVEYARSLGVFGFPWNLLGYMALASLTVAQAASLVGTYGLSLLLVLLGLLPVLWLGPSSRAHRTALSLLVLILCIGAYGYGSYRLSVTLPATSTMLRIVQPNVPQTIKGTQQGQAFAIKALGEFSTMHAKAPVPDMVVWPETAYPFTIREGEQNALPPLKLLLTGAVRAEGSRPGIKLWNSLVALDGHGTLLAAYDKHQLVPFGEFVPLRHVLPLEKITPGDVDFSRGSGPQTLAIAGLPPFSPLVCYEAIFPWMAADGGARPAWLLNVTNDAWYGDSAGPYQHFAMARMRAIEQGLPLVRAANSGISAVIDAQGRVVSSLGLGTDGFMDVVLPSALEPTLYARLGEVVGLCIVLALGALGFFYACHRKTK